MGYLFEMAKALYGRSKSKGWYERPKDDLAKKIGDDIHSEIRMRRSEMTADEMAGVAEQVLNDNYKRNIPEMICLMHSELSEALEEYRDGNGGRALNEIRFDENGKPIGFAVEMADVFIRIQDLCGYLGIDMDEAIAVKDKYNATRAHKHGGKLC